MGRRYGGGAAACRVAASSIGFASSTGRAGLRREHCRLRSSYGGHCFVADAGDAEPPSTIGVELNRLEDQAAIAALSRHHEPGV